MYNRMKRSPSPNSTAALSTEPQHGRKHVRKSEEYNSSLQGKCNTSWGSDKGVNNVIVIVMIINYRTPNKGLKKTL